MTEQIIDIVRTAGLRVKSAHCDNTDISVKPGEANFVTKYDVATQDFLKEKITFLYPGCSFIGEENGDIIKSFSEITVIIDPIDGTTNFIHDYKQSAISVGIYKNDRPYIGVVYNPYLDEMFSAKSGEGAFLNGKPIRVSQRGLKDALVAFGTSPYYPELLDKTFDTVKLLFKTCADIRRTGSSCIDLCNIAAGRTELYTEYVLSPWDFAGGSVIISEAGGIIKTAEGKELDWYKPNSVVAACPAAYEDYKRIMEL